MIHSISVEMISLGQQTFFCYHSPFFFKVILEDNSKRPQTGNCASVSVYLFRILSHYAYASTC
ncbi:hypothetical protein RchiOBHm_Chr1g0354721 [Rosa chinensis]|uniref:Uncharacterized protein n=1 Tax=Rosa chinensis TaxID=74649 RepID=A0A2P6SH61_ROSCH|nr:hypothetical protein RchiOBHm_Chr1g0354721 [Rosa chinensis]